MAHERGGLLAGVICAVGEHNVGLGEKRDTEADKVGNGGKVLDGLLELGVDLKQENTYDVNVLRKAALSYFNRRIIKQKYNAYIQTTRLPAPSA